jgi:hypothetical protein
VQPESPASSVDFPAFRGPPGNKGVHRAEVSIDRIPVPGGLAVRPGIPDAGGVSYWKVIMSVRLSVVAFGFKGSFAKFALPEFKTL